MNEVIRRPAPAVLAIDPRPFGFLEPELALFRRLRRAGIIDKYTVEGMRSLEKDYAHS